MAETTYNTNNLTGISKLFGVDSISEADDGAVATSTDADNWETISQVFGLDSTTETGDGTTSSTEVATVVIDYGQLTVVVDNNDGTSFTNPTDLEVEVTFVPDANGKWPIQLPHPDMTEEVLLPTTGDPEMANIATLAPSLPLAALIFQREGSEKYKEVGTQLTKTLEPEEKVYLFCNFYREGYEVPDNYNIATDLYSSNENSVTVWWFLKEVG